MAGHTLAANATNASARRDSFADPGGGRGCATPVASPSDAQRGTASSVTTVRSSGVKYVRAKASTSGAETVR